MLIKMLFGWRQKETWGYKTVLPTGRENSLSRLFVKLARDKTQKSLKQWQELGLRINHGGKTLDS